MLSKFHKLGIGMELYWSYCFLAVAVMVTVAAVVSVVADTVAVVVLAYAVEKSALLLSACLRSPALC